MDYEFVRNEARELIDKFGKDLSQFKIGKRSAKTRELSARKEKKGENCDVGFKIIMFKNAPHTNDLCLILEKGHWN